MSHTHNSSEMGMSLKQIKIAKSEKKVYLQNMDQKIIIIIADGANLFCTSTDIGILSVTICNELRKRQRWFTINKNIDHHKDKMHDFL